MILKKQQIIVNTRVERWNELREKKLKVEGIFSDEENGVEYLSISTEGNNFLHGTIEMLCEASGLRFYGVEIREDNKLCFMLF